jgi:transcriptional regulator with XRE-family HTH domain
MENLTNKRNEQFEGIGSRIIYKIEELKLTQRALAELSGVSKNAISNYVYGNRIPNTKELYGLSKTLRVTMEWLLTGVQSELAINIARYDKQKAQDISTIIGKLAVDERINPNIRKEYVNLLVNLTTLEETSYD